MNVVQLNIEVKKHRFSRKKTPVLEQITDDLVKNHTAKNYDEYIENCKKEHDQLPMQVKGLIIQSNLFAYHISLNGMSKAFILNENISQNAKSITLSVFVISDGTELSQTLGSEIKALKSFFSKRWKLKTVFNYSNPVYIFPSSDTELLSSNIKVKTLFKRSKYGDKNNKLRNLLSILTLIICGIIILSPWDTVEQKVWGIVFTTITYLLSELILIISRPGYELKISDLNKPVVQHTDLPQNPLEVGKKDLNQIITPQI